jgi:hypothetical protein
MSTGAPLNGDGNEAFRHEAFFYRDEAEYMAGTAPLITEGLSMGAAVVVATAPQQIDQLRQELAADAGLVRWVNIRGIGGNPARIIPLWRLSPGRADNFALAVHAAADSLSRIGTRGPKTGLVWRESDSVVCELNGEGTIEDPLAGREWPPSDEHHGGGLWLANQLCNLVQLRALPTGMVVRLHMAA